MSDDRLSHLEARFAWLERHVGEQDRTMVSLADELRRLREELARLRARTSAGGDGEPAAPEGPPPHY